MNIELKDLNLSQISEETKRFRGKKIKELQKKVSEGGKLTDMEKNILKQWIKMYFNPQITK